MAPSSARQLALAQSALPERPREASSESIERLLRNNMLPRAPTQSATTGCESFPVHRTTATIKKQTMFYLATWLGSDLVREAGRQPAARGEPPRQALGLWHTPDLRGRANTSHPRDNP